MNETEDLVTISDDESPSEQYQTKTSRGYYLFSYSDPIVIDESLPSPMSDLNDDIEMLETTATARRQTVQILAKNLYEKNRYLAELIETCINLENSDGMLRIIQRTLIRFYNEADESYKKSKSFEKVIRKAYHCLENDPEHKYSHMKNLCDTLKFHQAKKRVQLITLATNLKGDNHENQKRKRDFLESPSKKHKMADIILDSSEEDSDVISIEDSQPDNDVIMLESEARNDQTVPEFKENMNGITTENETVMANVENSLVTPCIEAVYQLKDSPGIENLKIDKSIDNFDDKENIIANSLLDDDDKQSFLTPNIEAEFESEPSQSTDNTELDKKIQEIEKEILQQKLLVEMYDEQEVTDDSKMSPYILSEKAKARIVELYEQLCSLTGQTAVKKRKIRLQVLEGHPPGPTRKLEEFINNNIGENGEPPFPDFCDVVACVLEASTEYGLGWKKNQVMKEASSLFVQCGQALQKRRQQREYRDLCSLVKAEPVGSDDEDPTEEDPAEEDPELRRKLEENRRRALKKENELLERYTMMQYLPDQPKPGPSLEPHINCVPSTTAPVERRWGKQNGGQSSKGQIGGPCDVITTAVDDSESDDCDDSDDSENSDLENENNIHNNNDKKVSEAQANDLDIETIEKSEKTSDAPHSDLCSDVKIKKEPVDVAKILDELGDDYSSTVIEIKDPLLVIEISSDGSEFGPRIETHAVDSEQH